MTIRQFAKEHDHEVVGKLTRRTDWSSYPDFKWYIDEARNEYGISRQGIVIVTADGAVI